MPRTAFLLLVLLLVACSESPTSPLAVTEVPVTEAALAGTWSGSLGGSVGGEDWSSVRVTLSAANGAVTGEMVTSGGMRHSISGPVENGHAILIVGDLPANAGFPCGHVQIAVGKVEIAGATPRALIGTLGGRCPNTLLAGVRLHRV